VCQDGFSQSASPSTSWSTARTAPLRCRRRGGRRCCWSRCRSGSHGGHSRTLRRCCSACWSPGNTRRTIRNRDGRFGDRDRRGLNHRFWPSRRFRRRCPRSSLFLGPSPLLGQSPFLCELALLGPPDLLEPRLLFVLVSCELRPEEGQFLLPFRHLGSERSSRFDQLGDKRGDVAWVLQGSQRVSRFIAASLKNYTPDPIVSSAWHIYPARQRSVAPCRPPRASLCLVSTSVSGHLISHDPPIRSLCFAFSSPLSRSSSSSWICHTWYGNSRSTTSLYDVNGVGAEG
jgi:hypothetical protein